MSGKGWRTTHVCDSRLEAELVVRLLESHGMEARTGAHANGFAILVPAEEADRAIDRLAAV